MSVSGWDRFCFRGKWETENGLGFPFGHGICAGLGRSMISPTDCGALTASFAQGSLWARGGAFFDRAEHTETILSSLFSILFYLFSGAVLALSVTFGDSSPRVRAGGIVVV